MNDHWNVLYQVSVFFADSCRSRHFEFHIGTKNLKIVEDHPMNIHVQFGFSQFISFREENFLFFMPIGNPRWPPPQDID
jgi:hypothetical protein